MQTLPPFDDAILKTRRWLEHLAELMAWTDLQQSYMLLRSVLHALRDRLMPAEAVQLGAQLPMLVRGFYYEGWHPNDKPRRYRHKAQFLQQIEREFPGHSAAEMERGITTVFALLDQELTGGEVDHVRAQLPPEVRELWVKPGM